MSDHGAPRPATACVICPPPTDGRPWRPADDGYRTCNGCYTAVHTTLLEIDARYAALDPTPGGTGETGGRPPKGFGSRPPVNLHIVAMRDPRSKSHEVAYDGVEYLYDPDADGGAGAYVARREVWYGADGRAHTEQTRPVRSVPGTLAAIGHLLAEERDATPPRGGVPDLIRWIDGQLGWLTRTDLVVDVYDDLRALRAQLRPVTGDARKRIGTCPNLPEGAEQLCGAPLYAPTRGDSISCTTCGRVWHRPEWERLGLMLQSEREAAA